MSATVPSPEVVSQSPVAGRMVARPVGSAWTRADTVLLGIVMLVAVLLRITHIDPFPSLDEIWHLGLTAGNGSPMSQFEPGRVYAGPPSWSRLESARPFWNVWWGMDGVLHPPLYCLSLRLWRDLLGASDLAAHAHSMFWSVIAIGFLFDTARRSMDRIAAMLVGLAMAVSQTQIYFAQEIRGYQMMIALATIAVWLITRIEREGVRRRKVVCLAWLTLPLLLTHYFAAGGALAIGVWGLLRFRGLRTRFTLHLVATAVVYGATWVPFALKQVDDLYTGDVFLVVENLTPTKVLLSILCAPLRPIADLSYQKYPWTALAGLFLVVPFFTFRRLGPLLSWAVFLVCGLVPLVVLDVVRSTIHLDFARYLSVITPAAFLLVVGCGWAFSRGLGYAMAILAIALGGYFTWIGARMYFDGPNLIAQVQTLDQRLKPGEAVIIYPGAGPRDLGEMMIMSALHRKGMMNRPFIILHEPMDEAARRSLPARAWLFTLELPLPLRELVPGAEDLPGSFRDIFQYVYLRLDAGGPSASTQPSSAPTR